MWVKTDSQRLKNFILNFDDNYKFIRSFSAGFGWFEDWIPKIIDVWGSDKIVFVSEEIESDDKTLIGFKDIEVNSEVWNYWYQIFIYSEEEALRMIPVISCPNFTCKFDLLLNKRYDQYSLYLGLAVCSILLVKRDGIIKYQEIGNQMYDYDPNEYYSNIENTCEIKNCCWKPIRVWGLNKDNFEDVFSAIEWGQISTNAREFAFKYIRFSNSGFHPGAADIKALWKLMSLFDINKKSIINIKDISINYQDKFEKQNELKINSMEFLLVFEKKLYKIQCQNSDTTWRGLAYIPNDNDTVVIQWEDFTCSKISITLEDDNSLFKQEWYEKFPHKYSSNGLDLYLVIKKSDIIEFTHSQLEDFENIWTLPNLQKAGIKTTESDYEKNEFVNILKSIPKTAALEIHCKGGSWYLYNEKFWIELFKFKKAIFRHNDYWDITIHCEGQELDEANILKSKIKASVNNHNTTITIDQVSDIFIFTYLKYDEYLGNLNDDSYDDYDDHDSYDGYDNDYNEYGYGEFSTNYYDNQF